MKNSSSDSLSEPSPPAQDAPAPFTNGGQCCRVLSLAILLWMVAVVALDGLLCGKESWAVALGKGTGLPILQLRERLLSWFTAPLFS